MTEVAQHIFISYARADAHYAERLDRELQAHGFTTWRDTRNLDTSQDFTGEIEQAIRAASHVVVCLTPNIEQRPDSFVRREIAYALGRDEKRKQESPPRRLFIIPVVFPGGELPLQISTWTKISWGWHR